MMHRMVLSAPSNHENIKENPALMGNSSPALCVRLAIMMCPAMIGHKDPGNSCLVTAGDTAVITTVTL